MVSRRKILSRSRDELHSDIYFTHDEEDDIWHNKSKLYQDHIQEVMDKWDSIDDEIWAKVIVLERNRRVAKAYARAPVLTLNGSDEGFDGFRIGVGGFENPHRDPGTDAAIRQIGMGCKLKMDDIGNILIKRITKSPVKVKNINEDSAVSNDILKCPGGVLDFEKPFKVFDMKKFQQNVNRELKRTYPDRAKLETQCISVVSFGTGEIDVLDCPVWILVVNIVAVEMIRSKLPQVSPRIRPHSLDSRPMTNGPTSMRPFGSGSSDEDPYSVAGSGSSGSSGGNAVNNRSRSRDKPPKLPPRDTNIYGPKLWAKPAEQEQKKKGKQRSGGEDPYYSGLRARIPNFVKSRKKKQKEAAAAAAAKSPPVGAPNSLPPQIPTHPFWWHSRLYSDNQISLGPGVEADKVQYQRNPTNFMPYVTDSSDSDYSHIYGRLGMAGRGGPGMRKFPAKPLFMSRWE